eukprot:gene10174-biopygen7744
MSSICPKNKIFAPRGPTELWHGPGTCPQSRRMLFPAGPGRSLCGLVVAPPKGREPDHEGGMDKKGEGSAPYKGRRFVLYNGQGEEMGQGWQPTP